MKQSKLPVEPIEPTPSAPPSLLDVLRDLIQQGRQKALRAVDMVQVQTCWEIGRHIVEFEQGGETRAAYGKKLLPRLAEVLTWEFGKGFDERNLRNMRAFYQGFPIWNAVRTELSWTHYRALLRVTDAQARQWYMTEATSQNWSARALDRQIGTLYFERLTLSNDKADRPRLLQLPAQVLCPDRPEDRAVGTPRHWPDGHVCAHVRRSAAWRRRQPHRGHLVVRT